MLDLMGSAAELGGSAGRIVGRQAELHVVDTALDALVGQRGGALAFVGAAGVGKSRLARETAARAAAAGGMVLTGRAVATGASTPYRPLVEALAPWARMNARARPDLGAHGRALDVLVPGWATGPAAPLSPIFVAEALLQLLPTVTGDAPALLVLEDLHWADEETIAAVEYVVDAAETLPSHGSLLVVITARDDEGPIARRTVRALAARGSLRLISLSPLDAVTTRELAVQRLGTDIGPALASLLSERAEGLPLFVEELLSALAATNGLTTTADGTEIEVAPAAVTVLPDTVADTVSSRLEAMPAEHRQVVEAAALLGRSFDHDLVAKVYDGVVAPALQQATTLGLLHEDPDRPGKLRFRHALLRDGVVASTYPPRRVDLARALLGLLTARELSDDELDTAVDLAVRAGDNALAARLALRRAMDAFELWAMGTAERGLAEARNYAGDDPELLIEIDVAALKVASIVGRLAVVMRLGQALLTRLDAPGGRHDAELLETHLRLGQALLDEEQWREAEPHLTTAASLIHAGDPCQVTRLELWSSLLDRLRGDVSGARARAARAADLARPDDYQADLVCCALLYEGRAWLPDVERARARWTESLDYAASHGVRLWYGRLLVDLALLDTDDLPGDRDIDDALLQADAIAREYGAIATRTRLSLVQARIAVVRGDVDAAVEALDRAENYGVASAFSRRAHADLQSAIAVLGHADTGELTAAGRVLSALAADDIDAARTAAHELADDSERRPLSLFADLVQEHTPHAFGAAVEARGLLPDFSAAVKRLAAAPLVAAFFTRLFATGKTAERGELHAAVATFERLGLTRPADACRALLREAGVPVPRRTSAQGGVPDELRAVGVTARELEVLHLIADGLTNKDVAAALYLSPRTVEKHVERLLLKTGAPNRTALAALARP